MTLNRNKNITLEKEGEYFVLKAQGIEVIPLSIEEALEFTRIILTELGEDKHAKGLKHVDAWINKLKYKNRFKK